jgi:hypothetical protein
MCEWLYCILEHIPSDIRLGVVSLNRMAVLFLVFWWDLHIAFLSSCTNLHSHQQCRSIPFFPHPHQHLLLFVIDDTILTGVEVESQYHFNLYFFYGQRAILHMFIGHLYFWELSVQFICPFIQWVVDSLRGYLFDPSVYYGSYLQITLSYI